MANSFSIFNIFIRLFASSALNRGFDLWSSQIKYIKT